MPRLMQDQNVLQSSPFHSITEVDVKLDVDPKNGDVYLPESWKPDAFALSKPGFMKLFSAAGMEEIPDQCISAMPEDRIFYYKSVIKWTQSDGTEVILTGDKTMDLRKGGTRWEKAYESALDWQVIDWAGSHQMPKQKKANGYNETNPEYCNRLLATLESVPEHGPALVIMRATAKQKANREMNQKAQFGNELAQTGAIARAVKGHLGMKSTYSEKELLEGFTLIRSTFRWDMLSEHLGQERARQLKDAYVMKAMGLTAGDLGGNQLPSGEPEPEETPDAADLFSDEDVIEGELVGDEDGAPEYLTPIRDQTTMRIRNKMMRFHGWRDFNLTKASQRTTWLFNCVFGDLTEGFALLLIVFYDKIQGQKDAGVNAAEITEQARHLKEQIDQCVIQKRLWKEPAETAEQLPLEEEASVDAE